MDNWNYAKKIKYLEKNNRMQSRMLWFFQYLIQNFRNLLYSSIFLSDFRKQKTNFEIWQHRPFSGIRSHLNGNITHFYLLTSYYKIPNYFSL